MKIIYKHASLQNAPERFIVHGCNAQGVMGSGVAAFIRADHTYAYDLYRETYLVRGKKLEMGQTIWAEGPDKTIINAVTQEFYGREPNTVYVDYEAIRKAFKDIDLVADMGVNGVMCPDVFGQPIKVAMPLIGAGLAQGKWSIISAIIEEESASFQPVVYLMDGVIPDGVQGEVQ